jgi:chromosome segregation ATPase
MSMWFYDETNELEDYQRLQKEIRAVEGEYLELRTVLREARDALRAEPESEECQVRVRYLEKRLKDLEKKYPWLAWDAPVEVALFSPPHG